MMEMPEHKDDRQKVSPEEIPARIIGIILAPRKTFAKVIYRTGAWIPIAAIALFLIILRLVMLPAIIDEFESSVSVEQYAEQRDITAEEAKKEIEEIVDTAPYLTFIESPILVISGVVVIALIVFLIGKLQFKSSQPFIVVFRMVAWASIVSVIQLILTIGLKLIDLDLEAPTNLGILFSEETAGAFFHNIMQTIDLFLIWEAYLIGVGMSVMYNISMQRSISAIGTMFVIFIALNAIFASQLL